MGIEDGIDEVEGAVASISDTIGELYRTSSDAEVEHFLLDTREALLADPDGDVGDLVVVCNELGSMYRESGLYAESNENFETALRGTEQIMGTRECVQCAVILLNSAGTCRYQRAFDEALSRYAEARGILEALGQTGTYEYASLLNNLSLTYLDMGECDRALELATTAHNIVVELKPGEAQEAISLVNLASLALRAGDMETAAAHSRQAIDIYTSLGVTSGHYPAAVNLAAVIDFKRGAYEEALAGFERSAELTERNFGRNRDYASALVNMAAVLEKLGRADEARAKLAEAEQVRGQLS